MGNSKKKTFSFMLIDKGGIFDFSYKLNLD